MDRIHVMQLVRSFQVGEIDRREFLRRASTALGSVALANTLLAACTPVTGPTEPVVVKSPAASNGSAPLAASSTPVMEAIAAPQTASPEVQGVLVDYPDADGETLMGYLARPADTDPHRAVVVIQEWWGLNEHIKDVARRFAQEGYVALAPDLYHGVAVSEPNEARKLVMELDMAEAVSEIRQAIDFLQAQDYVAGPKVGITGFCMGGGLTLMTALEEEDLGAAIPWYGSPLNVSQAANVKAPVLGLYGSRDGGIPVSAVRAMEEGLNAAGIENEIVIYEGAQHAFFNDTRASYDAEAAADAWQRALGWLERWLG